MTHTFVKQINKEMNQLGVSLTELQVQQFYTYYEMLIETNKVMNLTAITEEKDVITKHFTDSVSLLKIFSSKGEESVLNTDIKMIDVGTGAGFPGIPLKIVFPNIKLTLLDSLNKRVNFLQNVCAELELKNVCCVHGRAEDVGRKAEYREQYDLCVSRAVANLSSLSEYCLPFVKIGGHFIPYKSGEIQDEIAQAHKAVSILGGEIIDTVRFDLPDSDVSRSLIKIKKIKMISKKYPRKAGLPTKEPIR